MNHWIFLVLVSVLCLMGTSGQQRTKVRPVLEETFERKRSELWQKLEKHDQLEVVKKVGVNGGSALRATYVPYEKGSKRIVVRYPIKPALEYSLNYDVLFEEDFDFTHGGKLHGLGPDKPLTGGRDQREDGWSARVNFTKGGGTKLYDYHQDMRGQYGESGTVRARSFRFRKGKWASVSLHVRVNEDLRARDGFAHLYIDGKLIETHDKVCWRAAGKKDTLISEFLFSTFHGGSSEKWAPRDKRGRWAEVHALFDNIAVYPGKRVRVSPGT